MTYRDKLIVTLVSFCLLLVGIGNVKAMLGDEHCYVNAAKDFLNAGPSTNPEHPPLDKYFMAATIRVFGDRPIGWRFACVLAGTLLSLSVFGATCRLTRNLRTAYVAWLLSLAGGFSYMMSRFANLSIFELAFEMTAIWLFLIAREDEGSKFWVYSGLMFGLSVASRWMGAMGLMVCLLASFIAMRFYKPCLMGMVAVTTYAATWIPLLVKEHRPLSYLITANLFVYRFHHYDVAVIQSEPWITWLVPTHLFRSAFLIANPIIGILGLCAFGVTLWSGARYLPFLPGALYIFHLAPWALAVRANTYYYYYFESYTFLVIMLAIVMSKISIADLRVEVPVLTLAGFYFLYWLPAWGSFPLLFHGMLGNYY